MAQCTQGTAGDFIESLFFYILFIYFMLFLFLDRKIAYMLVMQTSHSIPGLLQLIVFLHYWKWVF